MLIHYDPSKESELSYDASQYGLGSLLTQRSDDGTEQPVYFASNDLSTSEQKYSQIDKEVIAIIYSIKRFQEQKPC